VKVVIGPNPFGLENGIDALAARYPHVVFRACDTNDELTDALADATVYLGWLTADQFASARNLRWIQSPSTGIDKYLAIPGLKDSDVIITSARGTHGIALAEHAFALILSFTRGIRDAILAQTQHRWETGKIRPTLTELRGTTIGIIGFGTIGRALAERARAFEMRVVAVDVQRTPCPDYVSWVGDLSRLDDLLSESDFVVVTIPYTESNYHLVNEARIRKMKPRAILIGVSRGGIIDEVALESALADKTIRAAAIDVVEHEPLPDENPLWDIENLLITPHIAGGSQYETESILTIFGMNLDRYIRRELPLHNQIDKSRGY
jgi:phosphoglycerate dehydrogenase-like enzyme